MARCWRRSRPAMPMTSNVPRPRPRPPQLALRGALEHLDPGADRPGRRDHAVEYAVHAVDLEDRAGIGRGLHGGAQAGGMVAGDRRPPVKACETGWPA